MNSSRQRLGDIAREWFTSVFLRSHEEIDDESIPLVNRTFRSTWCEYLWISLIVIIFIVGVGSSTYLLIVEGEDPVPVNFTLVLRSELDAQLRCTNVSKPQLPFQRLLLLPTNTSKCGTDVDCLEIVSKLQIEHKQKLNETDILYNFIFTGDNRIFEGRGWECSSLFGGDDVSVLTIAFVGVYRELPTEHQIETVQAFLEYGIAENRLSSCYYIIPQKSTTQFINKIVEELKFRRDKNIC